MVRAGGEGKAALTWFDPVARTELATLARVTPATGRTHQIRVHGAHMGHPVAGDSKYGDTTFNRQLSNLGLKRLFLHAWSLRFLHPITGQELLVTAPLADELRALLTVIGLQTIDGNEA